MEQYHLVYFQQAWQFKKALVSEPIASFDLKETALDYAVDYMRQHGGSLMIHRKDGQFQEERTYPRSADPPESKG